MTTLVQQPVTAQPAAPTSAGKLCIILSKGTLDMVYPAFMLAQTAAAMGQEVHVFLTFWGLGAMTREHIGKLRVASVGNPGLPMPNIVGMLPGMTAMATTMMKRRIEKAHMAPIPDMVRDAAAMGVQIHACSTTMEVMGIAREDLVPEIMDVVGAASFLEMAEGGQTLFI